MQITGAGVVTMLASAGRSVSSSANRVRRLPYTVSQTPCAGHSPAGTEVRKHLSMAILCCLPGSLPAIVFGSYKNKSE